MADVVTAEISQWLIRLVLWVFGGPLIKAKTGQVTMRRRDKTCPDALGHFAALVRLLCRAKWQNLSGVTVDVTDCSKKRQ